MKNNKIILGAFALLTFVITSCDYEKADVDVEDVQSTDRYPTPSFTLAGQTSFDETSGDQTYVIDIVTDRLIGQPLEFTVIQTGGDATLNEDYTITKATIPAFTNTGQIIVTILQDAVAEGTETLQLTVIPGPAEASAYLPNPDTVYPVINLQIQNFEGGDLEINLQWDADNGSGDSPTELADLILLVTNTTTPYTNVITSADGGDFEDVTITADTPDGEYFVVVDVFAFDDSDFDLDLTLTINQAGVTNDFVLTYPSALNSQFICSNYLVLAKITKSGTNYTVTSEDATVVNDGTPDMSSAAPFIGTATVITDDWADYDPGAQITIEANPSNPNQFYIRAYSNPFISNPDTAYMIVTLDPCGTANVTTNEAFDYGCSDGAVTGNGTVDPSTQTIDLSLDFDLGNCGAFAGQHFVLQL